MRTLPSWQREAGAGHLPSLSPPLPGLLEPPARGHCLSGGCRAQGALLVCSSSQGSGTTAPPLTCGVLGASWQRCGPAALSCRATQSSTSLPSSASFVAPSLLRYGVGLPGPLGPTGCREVSLAGEGWVLNRGKAPFWRGCWWVVGVCSLEPHRLFKSRLHPFSSVALGRASEPLTSELSCCAVRQLVLSGLVHVRQTICVKEPGTWRLPDMLFLLLSPWRGQVCPPGQSGSF